jgi:hypothetical protein
MKMRRRNPEGYVSPSPMLRSKKDHKTKINTVRYTSLSDTGSIGVHYITLQYSSFTPTHSTQLNSIPLQQQLCPRAASSVPPLHRRISCSNIVINASPPCIVPGLVRGSIGRRSISKSASFSTSDVETCRCGMRSTRNNLLD